jgi:hypothetical protein
MKHRIAHLAAVAVTAVGLIGLAAPAHAAPAHAAAPKPVRYKNCAALNKVYKHGVAQRNARDKVKSGTPVTTFTVNTAAYKKNTHLDRDKDGVACEKK